MVYPSDGNPITEMLINGVWTNVASYVKGDAGIRITRGNRDEQTRASPQTCLLNLNNRDGRFSNRNPLSPYYGLLPLNTQIRVLAGSIANETYLRLRHDFSDDISYTGSTPNDAVFNIAGDIELRAEIWPYSSRPRAGMVVFAKYSGTSNQRSWCVCLTSRGLLQFIRTTDGTNATRFVVNSTAAIPIGTTRFALKVQFDADNGSGGNTITFSIADSIDGTYSVLGSPVVTAGVSSIFIGNAAVTVAGGADSGAIFSGGDMYVGKLYKARVYNTAGTIVANPDWTNRQLGDVFQVDSAGRTWTYSNSSLRVTSDRVRFWGEASALPKTWDKPGVDVMVPVQAAGMLRRLTQGASPTGSPMRRMLTQRALQGYLPLEDGSDSTAPASAVTGAANGQSTAVRFASEDTLPGTLTAASFIDATSKIAFNPRNTGTTGTAFYTQYFRLPSLPAAKAVLTTLYTSGTAIRITISVTTTGFVFDLYDASGTVLDTAAINFGTSPSGVSYSPVNQWIGMNFLLTTSGGNVSWVATWTSVATESFVATSHPAAFAGSAGRITKVLVAASASSAYYTANLAHLHTANSDLSFVTAAYASSANAYLGETAANRMIRLAAEESQTVEVTGDTDTTETMGYQKSKTFVELIQECADADQGLLGEARDTLAIQYITRLFMEHRSDITLSESAKHLAAVPGVGGDDQGVTNDVTVNRTNAGSGRREIESGPMSVLTPPNGIGRYATEVTLNVRQDSRLAQIASWKATTSATDADRVPNLTVGLHRTPLTSNAALSEQMRALELGRTANLTGLPAWVVPDALPLIVRGYTEVMDKFLWTVSLNTTPAQVFDTGRYDYETVTGLSRYDHSTSTTNGSHNPTTTSLSVAANSSTPLTPDLWTTVPASFPFDIMVAGERMTVTNCVGTSSPQTMTVTRSVNGIVKTIPAGSRVRLFRPVYYEL